MPQSSDVYPRIMRMIRERAELIDLYETQAVHAASAEAQYDAARESVKLKKRLLEGVKTNAEAETWAKVDPEVVRLDIERGVQAAHRNATKLRVDNMDTEIRVLHSMLVREREGDRQHAQHGEG